MGTASPAIVPGRRFAEYASNPNLDRDLPAEIRADDRYERIRGKWFDRTDWFDRYR